MSTSTPTKYEILREILDKLGFSDWTIIKPSPAVPNDVDGLCILIKGIPPEKRAEFGLDKDLFQFGSQSQKLVLAIKKGLSEAETI